MNENENKDSMLVKLLDRVTFGGTYGKLVERAQKRVNENLPKMRDPSEGKTDAEKLAIQMLNNNTLNSAVNQMKGPKRWFTGARAFATASLLYTLAKLGPEAVKLAGKGALAMGKGALAMGKGATHAISYGTETAHDNPMTTLAVLGGISALAGGSYIWAKHGDNIVNSVREHGDNIVNSAYDKRVSYLDKRQRNRENRAFTWRDMKIKFAELVRDHKAPKIVKELQNKYGVVPVAKGEKYTIENPKSTDIVTMKKVEYNSIVDKFETRRINVVNKCINNAKNIQNVYNKGRDRASRYLSKFTGGRYTGANVPSSK